MFDLLPLAAAIEDQFLCINNGIGRIPDLIELKNIERPIKVKDSQVLINMFWPDKGSNELLGYKGEGYSETELEAFLE